MARYTAVKEAVNKEYRNPRYKRTLRMSVPPWKKQSDAERVALGNLARKGPPVTGGYCCPADGDTGCRCSCSSSASDSEESSGSGSDSEPHAASA